MENKVITNIIKFPPLSGKKYKYLESLISNTKGEWSMYNLLISNNNF